MGLMGELKGRGVQDVVQQGKGWTSGGSRESCRSAQRGRDKLGAYPGLVWCSPSLRPSRGCPGRGPGGRVADTRRGWHLVGRGHGEPRDSTGPCRAGTARAVELPARRTQPAELLSPVNGGGTPLEQASGGLSSYSLLPQHSWEQGTAGHAASRCPEKLGTLLSSFSQRAGSEQAVFQPSLHCRCRQTAAGGRPQERLTREIQGDAELHQSNVIVEAAAVIERVGKNLLHRYPSLLLDGATGNTSTHQPAGAVQPPGTERTAT